QQSRAPDVQVSRARFPPHRCARHGGEVNPGVNVDCCVVFRTRQTSGSDPMSIRRISAVNWRLGLWVLLAVSLAGVPRLIGQEKGSGQKGGGDETGQYEVVRGWPEHPREGWVSGPVTGIFAESP